jgi:DNA (cytosine-5)-methyltransferase 1
MTRPRLLDLFCGAGGAARGYQMAGFHVTGIDIRPQPRYAGDLFIQGDALHPPVRLGDFDVIHASPPCQADTAYRRRPNHVKPIQRLIWPTRHQILLTGKPYVIENVPRAPLDEPLTLCGSSFGLTVRRHRWFESNRPLLAPPCAHGQQHGSFPQATNRENRRRTVEVGVWRIPLPMQQDAMGIDWMTLDELSEALPPAYTEWIGSQLIEQLERAGQQVSV